MLSKEQVNAYLAIIIETLDTAGPRGFPSGHLYAAICSHVTLDEYNGLLTITKSVGLVTESGHVLTVTDRGRDLAAKLAGHRAKQEAAAGLGLIDRDKVKGGEEPEEAS